MSSAIVIEPGRPFPLRTHSLNEAHLDIYCRRMDEPLVLNPSSALFFIWYAVTFILLS